MLPAVLVSLLLSQSSPTLAGTGGPSVSSASPAGPDFFTYLNTPLATAAQCLNAASITSDQGDAITCTRASTAFCTKDTGTIVSHANNRCRVSDKGLLREPAGTKLSLRSEALDDAGAWSLFSASLTGTNVGVFVDGNTTMEQITSNDGNGNAYQSVAVVSSVGPFTVSGYFSKASGTGIASIIIDCGVSDVATCTCEREDGAACVAEKNGEGAVSDPGICTAYSTFGTSPKRLSATVTCAAEETGLFIAVSGGQRHYGGVETYGGVSYVGGLNLETGPVPTSYVPTAGTSATRSAETIVMAYGQSIDTAGCIGATLTYGTGYPGAGSLIAFDVASLATSTSTGITLTDGAATATATVAPLLSNSTPIRGFWNAATMGVAASGTQATAAFAGTATGVTSSFTLGSTGYYSDFRANVNPRGCRP